MADQITGAEHGQANEKAQEIHKEAEVSPQTAAQEPYAFGSAAAAAQLAGTSRLQHGYTLPLVLLAVVAIALVASAIGPTDRLTWWLEVAPVLIAAPVLIVSARRFPLTSLVYVLIAIHALILILGGHYTYAQVPAGFWVQDLFDLARNPYDRLGHLAQGFVPAMIAREILLRASPLKRGGWLFFIVCCIVLAVSACYEFIEWWTALIGGGSAEAFLGMQGDVWDTQWDMFLALCGAIAAQLTLSRLHDRGLARLVDARV